MVSPSQRFTSCCLRIRSASVVLGVYSLLRRKHRIHDLFEGIWTFNGKVAPGQLCFVDGILDGLAEDLAEQLAAIPFEAGGLLKNGFQLRALFADGIQPARSLAVRKT